MRLVDFQIDAEDGFADQSAVNRRCLHIGDAVRRELARRRPALQAPFGKLVIDLFDTGNTTRRRPTTLALSVARVRVGVTEQLLNWSCSSRRNRRRSGTESWSSPTPRAVPWRA